MLPEAASAALFTVQCPTTPGRVVTLHCDFLTCMDSELINTGDQLRREKTLERHSQVFYNHFMDVLAFHPNTFKRSKRDC